MFKDIEILDDLGLIKCTLAKRDPLLFFTRAWIAGAYCGIKIKDETSKLLLRILFVMAFVLPGFEHCIANAGTFTLGIALLGNQISWAALPLHMLISTLGNIIGGSIFLALPVYIIFRQN